MSARAEESPSYFVQLFALLRHSATQLVRAPSHSQRAEAARRLARHALVLTAILGACVISLMIGLDAREIALMPARGTPDLWPVRILTDFGNDAYVLWMLAAALIVIGLASPLLQATARARMLRFGTQVQYLFFAVLVPVLFAEVVKWVAGRGRPFVGGKANPFNFAPFTGTEAYFSFPSAHAVTGFALAVAIGAVWPRAQPWMLAYALLIAASRLVLLAHHPSDVVAGALIGVLGAMAVRYWFAARQLGFAIHGDGKIVPL
jgi:membrane-associated phospholipid phosphatase